MSENQHGGRTGAAWSRTLTGGLARRRGSGPQPEPAGRRLVDPAGRGQAPRPLELHDGGGGAAAEDPVDSTAQPHPRPDQRLLEGDDPRPTLVVAGESGGGAAAGRATARRSTAGRSASEAHGPDSGGVDHAAGRYSPGPLEQHQRALRRHPEHAVGAAEEADPGAHDRPLYGLHRGPAAAEPQSDVSRTRRSAAVSRPEAEGCGRRRGRPDRSPAVPCAVGRSSARLRSPARRCRRRRRERRCQPASVRAGDA